MDETTHQTLLTPEAFEQFCEMLEQQLPEATKELLSRDEIWSKDDDDIVAILKGRPVRCNPYVDYLVESVTLDIDNATLDYFKAEGKRLGILYQNVIRLCLAKIAGCKKHLEFV